MKHLTPPDPQRSAPVPPPEPENLGDATFARTFRHLWPYIWPHDRADLRTRIFLAVVLLLAAKLVTIAIPYAFKWATDALTGERGHDVALPALLAGPIALTMLYGVLRVIMPFLTQVRDGR